MSACSPHCELCELGSRGRNWGHALRSVLRPSNGLELGVWSLPGLGLCFSISGFSISHFFNTQRAQGSASHCCRDFLEAPAKHFKVDPICIPAHY